VTGIRWASLATVVGGGVVASVCLVGVLLGHPWSAVPGGLGLLMAVREVRYLRRLRAGKIASREN
jgi:preprotein translocase subunit SecY